MPMLAEVQETLLLETETSTQVKFFIYNDPAEAEKAVAEWLAVNHIEIQHIGQSQGERGGKFLFTIILFYKKIVY